MKARRGYRKGEEQSSFLGVGDETEIIYLSLILSSHHQNDSLRWASMRAILMFLSVIVRDKVTT